MEGVLSQIVINNKETQKQLEKNNDLLSRILVVQEKSLKAENESIKQDKREAQAGRRKKADRNPLAFLKKEEDKAKKKGGILGGIFDTIKKLIGGLDFAKVLGLGAIGAYFASPEFRDFINKNILMPAWGVIKEGLIGPKGLFGSENQKKAWEWMKENPLKSLGLAVGGIVALIGPGSALMLAFKGLGALLSTLPFLKGAATVAPAVAPTVAAASGISATGILAGATGLALTAPIVAAVGGTAQRAITSESVYGGGEAGQTGLAAGDRLMELNQKNSRGSKGGGRSGSKVNLSKEEIEEEKALRKLTETITASERQRADDLSALKKSKQKGRGRGAAKRADESITKEDIENLEKEHQKRVLELREAHLKEGYKLQSGGFVGTVPNQGGNGDRFRTMVDAGSVVLNQTAAGYLTGGQVPVMLEQGEKVFGPRDPNAGAALMMNSMIPRFQEGGEVKSTGNSTIDSISSMMSTMSNAFSPLFSKLSEMVGGLFKSFGNIFSNFGMKGSSSMGFGLLGQAFTPYSPVPASTSGGAPPEITKGSKGLLDFISHYESGGSYNKIFGGAEIPGLTDMTIRQVVGVQNAHLNKGYESAAIGRYQMMYPDVYAKKAGLSLDDKFSEANQDKMGMVYLEEDGYSKFKSGQMSASQFANNVAGTWAALPMPDGRSRYAGVGSNAAHVDRGTYMQAIAASKMQQGGLAQVRGTNSASTSNMISKSQENFAKMIAQNMSPVIVPIPMGGGGGNTPAPNMNSADLPFPSLPAEDNSVVSMEYKYRITMGASV